MLAVRVANMPSLLSAASARRLKRRAKPESADPLPSVMSSLLNSVRWAAALSSLALSAARVPSACIVMPMSDKRDQLELALLPSLITWRNCRCSASVAWSPCNAPPVLLPALYAVWLAMKPASVLKALTKPVIAALTDAVSLATVTVTSLVLVLRRFKLKPSTTLLSVLLGELSAMPSTLSSALAALVVRSIGEPTTLASKASADRPVAGSPSSMSSLALTRKAFSAPLSLDRRLSLAPAASLTMDAVTPAPAALIWSRKPLRLVLARLIVTGELPAWALKPAAGVPLP